MSLSTKLFVACLSAIPWGAFFLVRNLTDDKFAGAAVLASCFLFFTPLLVVTAAAYGYMEGRINKENKNAVQKL